jgi:hypothetical protein
VEHFAECCDSVDAPRTGVDHVAFDEAQRLAAVFGEAGSDDAWRSCEADLFEIA